MKDSRVLFHITVLWLLGIVASTGCTCEIVDLPATRAALATQTAEVTPTVTPLPPIEVALKSSHGRYVTALGEQDGWELTQDTSLGDCGWFRLHHLACGKIALVTCNDKYVTAPESGTTRWDWMLRQEVELSECGRFDLYELGNDRVALKTCAGKFVTAGDLTWEPPWSVGAGTDVLLDWEIFVLRQ